MSIHVEALIISIYRIAKEGISRVHLDLTSTGVKAFKLINLFLQIKAALVYGGEGKIDAIYLRQRKR